MKQTQLKGDIFGGITAAVIAIPLALAFGVASGMGASAGLIGAITIGFIASFLGGTPVQISGPTGPMTVVVAALAIKYADNPNIIFSIIILCGIIQTFFGAFKLGSYVNYVPLPVISGFMTGIGIIIILMELPTVFGDYSSHDGVMDILFSLPHMIADFDISSVILGFTTFLIVAFIPKTLNSIIPGSLIALIVGTVASVFYFPEVKPIGEISTHIPALKSFSPPLDLLPEIITAAFMLALLGSIDTLLTSAVADKITKSNHNSNKELIAQGIGNAVVGFVGGLPGAGATMRTIVNVKSGGKTRLSGMLHAVIIVVVVLFLSDLAEKIPLCVLAGILLKVGLDIIDWSFIKRIKYYPKDKVLLMLSVLALTVFTDLVTAIGLGLILSHMIYSKKMNKTLLNQIQLFEFGNDTQRDFEDIFKVEKKNDEGVVIKFNGDLNYSVAKDLSLLINDAISNFPRVVLDFSEIKSLDISVASTLENIFNSVPEEKEIQIRVKDNEIYEMFTSLGVLSNIELENILLVKNEIRTPRPVAQREEEL